MPANCLVFSVPVCDALADINLFQLHLHSVVVAFPREERVSPQRLKLQFLFELFKTPVWALQMTRDELAPGILPGDGLALYLSVRYVPHFRRQHFTCELFKISIKWAHRRRHEPAQPIDPGLKAWIM